MFISAGRRTGWGQGVEKTILAGNPDRTTQGRQRVFGRPGTGSPETEDHGGKKLNSTRGEMLRVCGRHRGGCFLHPTGRFPAGVIGSGGNPTPFKPPLKKLSPR